MDLEAARAAARAQLSLLARGIDPRDLPKETTISGVIDRYERDRLGERRTGPEIARIIRKELGQRCGSLSIEALRRQHLGDVR